jgi:type II secretory ATPase GspE/PulE/Tfp pilus assembly ATPase PilB-like protein
MAKVLESEIPKTAKGAEVRGDFLRELLSELRRLTEECGTHDTPDLAYALTLDAHRERASDIHIEPSSDSYRIRLRIDGVLHDTARLTVPHARILLNQFKAIGDLDPIVRFTPKDTRATVMLPAGKLDLRLALAPCQHGEKLAIRLLDPQRLERSVRELGLEKAMLAQLEDWLENVSGMFLAAGPTGSGKTTTIYALLHELKFRNKSIISLEDPIEYQIDGITQIKVDELHHVDFAEGVKAILRLDPDYLMLGEMRDRMSARSAINAALSGRALLSTIHCRDAVGAVTTMRNWDVSDQEIAESLVVVVAQRLVRRLCDKCKKEMKPTDAELRWFETNSFPRPRAVWQPVGCSQCNEIGYLGRIGVFELWRLNEEDYSAILTHRDEHALRQALALRHGKNIVHDAVQKVMVGLTSLNEVRGLAATAQDRP